MPEKTATRRRGAELEEALLDAAWDELVSCGYGGFTFEGVAARAQTSRPVVYRRWASRADLAVAAIRHYGRKHPFPVPDTGSLRDDLVALLRSFSERRSELAVLMSMRMSEFFAETGATMADLREQLLADRTGPSSLVRVLERAAARGELDPRRLTPRLTALPVDLIRHEILMTGRPVSEDVITEIVDDIFLPLVRLRAR
ncbi:TetR family transcriptional regulator [Microbispora rosea subsp. aerata]|nr:TetR/AcrR family transcriptional regulator [Microbispora rosea]GGO18283.1 TetR family transcriptional regulator [Microbispora rosea subsp. aerata]GIH56681.1 TetR family transcriptional regulator [Microbispora rosea subsp. aerata]GLJ82054.1 TetR family transcriptional regulator [Microbispora rosea subsp. aerata]